MYKMMMKGIAFVTVCTAAAVGVGYRAYPDETTQLAATIARAAERVWENIEANPVPVFAALFTFLLTVVYHTTKGRSLRASVEEAATGGMGISAQLYHDAESENPVLTRAKARAVRTQLLADQIGIENRRRKLPAAITTAETETCYTEQAVTDAQRALAAKKKAHDEAAEKLEALRYEQAECDAELAEIAAELKRLESLV